MKNERLSWSRSSNTGLSSGASETLSGARTASRVASERLATEQVRGAGQGVAHGGTHSIAHGGSHSVVRGAATQNTVVGSGCGIKGELYFTGVAELNCRIEGEVASEGELVIGESAQVLGSIRAQRLMIFGAVSGEIVCSERIELHAGARVAGSICSPRVVMHDGVHFEGDCTMPSGEELKKAQDVERLGAPEIDDSAEAASDEERLANE